MFTKDSLTKIISEYELTPIETPDINIFGYLKLSIQICYSPKGAFFPRVLRKERIYAEPAYYEQRECLLEKVIIEVTVVDDSCEWSDFLCDSEAAALEIALDQLSIRFNALS
jgi:hypothetical protein